jgi:hypothetical protein
VTVSNVSNFVSVGFHMNISRIDRFKVVELRDKGMQVQAIASQLGVTKGAISKVLKKMGVEVVKVAVKEAEQHYEAKNDIPGGLSYLFGDLMGMYKRDNRGDPPKDAAALAVWLGPQLGLSGEVRKVAAVVADIYWKIYGVEQVTEFMRIVEEELSNESQELQKRVRDRFDRRRIAFFPNTAN